MIFVEVEQIVTYPPIGDSFISFIDLKISEKIHFGYSYDWTSSALTVSPTGLTSS